MVWLSGVVAYQQAEEVLRRVGHQVIPRMSIWRQGQKHGERLKRYHDHQRAAAGIERVVLSSVTPDHRRQKGISLDGGMVNIREEGWKEFKTGTVFDVVPYQVQDVQTGEKVELAGASAVRYTAVVGDVADFKSALWALALDHDVPCAARSSVTADGAAWIWNLVADDFPDSIQIVDWYHANEHLARAAHALYPKNIEAAQRWYQQMQTPLFQGQVWKIIQPLERAGLDDHARYFRTHQRRMQYLQFREEAYPIGSGTVESGIKQFKTRLVGPGMRWSRPAAQRMFILRAAILNQDFDLLWIAA